MSFISAKGKKSGYIPVHLDIPWSTGISSGFLINEYGDQPNIITSITTEYFLEKDEKLGVLGDIEALGNWDQSKPKFARRGQDGPGSWRLTFALPSDEMISLKWCIVKNHQIVRWEEGPNHMITGPNFGRPARIPAPMVRNFKLLFVLFKNCLPNELRFYLFLNT